MTFHTVLLSVAIVLIVSQPVQAQSPQLLIPSIHQNAVNDLQYAGNDQYLVSSASTEIKLWEAKTGRLIRTITQAQRPPVEHHTHDCKSGFEQVAVSPDGKFIISANTCSEGKERSHNRPYDEISGPTYITIWDSETGKFRKHIQISPNRVFIREITISPDGKQVAVSTATTVQIYDHLKEEFGFGVWDVTSGQLLLERPYESGKFSNQNNYVLSTSSNTIYYINTLSQRMEVSFFLDTTVLEMAISSNGKKVFATTHTELWAWDIKSPQAPKKTAIPELINEAKVFFSPDGQFLTLLGVDLTQYQISDGKRILQKKAIGGQEFISLNSRYAIDNNHHMIAYTHYTNDMPYFVPEISTIQIPPKTRRIDYGMTELSGNMFLNGLLPLLKEERAQAKILANGKLLYIEGSNGAIVLYLTMAKKKISSGKDELDFAILANDSIAVNFEGEIRVYDPQGTLAVKIGPNILPKELFSIHYDPLTQKLFLQTETQQRFYIDLKSASLSGPIHSKPPLREEYQEDARFKVTSNDGHSISLIQTNDQTELVKLIVFGEDNWIVTTPSGLFDGSEKGINKLYFVNGLEIIPLESYEARYWVPNLLQKLLSGLSPSEIRDVGALNLDELYPLIKARIEQDHLMIDIEKRAGGLGELNLYINGSIVQNDLNRQRKSHLKISLERYAKHYFTKQPNFISLQAFNQEGWLKSPVLELPAYTPGFPIQRDHKLAHFYAIIVGTSDYEGNQLDLRYAGKYAVSMHEALSIAGEQLFEDRMDIRLFTTDEIPKSGLPSKVNIKKAIDEITTKAEPIDLVLIYFAGHGKAIEEENSTPQFYYLTQSMRNFRQLEDPQARNLDAISQEELTDWLSEMGAKKKVMVLDACNSGQLVNSMIKDRAFSDSQIRALDRMRDRTGMYILAGSAADQESYEATPFGQGLLTYSLLQGMQELSIKDPNDEVDVLQLLMHAENQVPALAKSVGVVQKPKMYNQEGLSSFPIGIVNDPGAIPVAAVKPLLIQPLLLQEGELADPLDLVTQLEEHIHKLIRRGAHYTFQNIRKSELGYSIRGTYTIKGDAMVVKGYLRKGKTKVTGANFQVTGSRSNIQEIIFQLFNEVKSFLTN